MWSVSLSVSSLENRQSTSERVEQFGFPALKASAALNTCRHNACQLFFGQLKEALHQTTLGQNVGTEDRKIMALLS